MKSVTVLRTANLALRGIMEAGIVVALVYRGYRTGHSTMLRVWFGIGAPTLVFSLWAFVDFRKLGSKAELFETGEFVRLYNVAYVMIKDPDGNLIMTYDGNAV